MSSVVLYTPCGGAYWGAHYGDGVDEVDAAMRSEATRASLSSSASVSPILLPWETFEYEESDPFHFTRIGLARFAGALAVAACDALAEGEGELADWSVLVVGDSTIAHCDSAWDAATSSDTGGDGAEEGFAASAVWRAMREEASRRGVCVRRLRVVACCGSGYAARTREGLGFRHLASDARDRFADEGGDPRVAAVFVGGWNDVGACPRATLECAVRGAWNGKPRRKRRLVRASPRDKE